MNTELLQLIFPLGLLDYFEVESYEDTAMEIVFTMREKNLPPVGYAQVDLESKGFYQGGDITDFPLRGKRCVYKIKRRKWIVKQSQKVITRDWNIVAKGTRTTEEFASFLKELNRQYTS